MSDKKKNPSQKESFTFRYRTGTRIWLIAITALLALLLPVTWVDKTGAWVRGFPVIFAAVLLFVLFFLYTLLSESNQVVEVRRDSIYATYGVGPFKREEEIRFADVTELHEDTTLFSIGRKYSIRGDGKKIRLTSALGRYKDLLHLLVKRIPRDKVSDRAVRSLQKSRVLAS